MIVLNLFQATNHVHSLPLGGVGGVGGGGGGVLPGFEQTPWLQAHHPGLHWSSEQSLLEEQRAPRQWPAHEHPPTNMTYAPRVSVIGGC